MKNQLTLLFVSTLVCLSPPAHGQGILNGGFELYSPATQFLAGWHARGGAGQDYGTVVGGVSGSLLDYVNSTPSGLFAAIAGPVPAFEGFPIGNYWLFAVGPATTIEQRFLVSQDAGSLQYRAFNGFGGNGVSVQINGLTIDPLRKAVVQPGSAQSGAIEDWWVDMRSYAGQEVDLTFYIGAVHAGIDEVRVSTELVPEPGVMSLGALGGVTLLAWRRARISGR